MGNAVGSLGQVIGSVLGHPLDFLSGQSCNSICAPTWDIVCYIENFCVAHLLKFVMVGMLVYFVLLFLFLLYNLGICQCICHTFWRLVWACFATCFSSFNFCCTYLCYKLSTVKRNGRKRRRIRRRRKSDIENIDVGSTTSRSCSSTSGDEYELDERSMIQQPRKNLEHSKLQFNRKRNYKDEHLRRSLRPTNHRARLVYSGHHMHTRRNSKIDNPIHHHIRVTRSSRFSHKGVRGTNQIHRMRRCPIERRFKLRDLAEGRTKTKVDIGSLEPACCDNSSF